MSKLHLHVDGFICCCRVCRVLTGHRVHDAVLDVDYHHHHHHYYRFYHHLLLGRWRLLYCHYIAVKLDQLLPRHHGSTDKALETVSWFVSQSRHKAATTNNEQSQRSINFVFKPCVGSRDQQATTIRSPVFGCNSEQRAGSLS